MVVMVVFLFNKKNPPTFQTGEKLRHVEGLRRITRSLKPRTSKLRKCHSCEHDEKCKTEMDGCSIDLLKKTHGFALDLRKAANGKSSIRKNLPNGGEK